MYDLAVICSVGELNAYEWGNIKIIADSKFSNKLYNITLYQQSNIEKCFAELRMGTFDGLVIATNASNDPSLYDLLRQEKNLINNFIKSGKGLLVLLQYHLAANNQSIDLFCKDLFYDINENEENLFKTSGGDISKIYTKEDFICEENSILLTYPNDVIIDNFIYKAINNKYISTIVPAFFDQYNEQLVSSISLKDDKSILLYSTNPRRRIVLTTIPADFHEQNELLENMISYITRGKPKAVLLKEDCTIDNKCLSGNINYCTTEEHLIAANIHYWIPEGTDKKKKMIASQAEYALICNKKIVRQVIFENNKRYNLPIKTCLSFLEPDGSNSKIFPNIIIDIPNMSIIKRWVRVGWDWLLTKFRNGKWDTLFTSEAVLRLAEVADIEIKDDLKESITEYLLSHQQNGLLESELSFDGVKRATIAARNIVKIFKLIELQSKYDEWISKNRITEKIEYENIVITKDSVSKAADYAVKCLENEEITEEDKQLLSKQILPLLITSRDHKKASWGNDCFITAKALHALVLFENKADEIGIDIIKTYLVCECCEQNEINMISFALEKNVENTRRIAYQKSKSESELIIKLKDAQNRITIFENIESQEEGLRNAILRRNIALVICFTIITGLMFLLLLFIFYVVPNIALNNHGTNYWSVIGDFFATQGILGAIIGTGGVIATVFAIGVFFRGNKKKKIK